MLDLIKTCLDDVRKNCRSLLRCSPLRFESEPDKTETDVNQKIKIFCLSLAGGQKNSWPIAITRVT